MLQSEISEMKKDFSQNLADVKSSMIMCGYEDENEENENTSMPHGDMEMENHVLNISGGVVTEEIDDRLSNASKNSFIGHGFGRSL